MANTISKGYTFGSTELVTNAKLHTLVDSATLSLLIAESDMDIASTPVTDYVMRYDGSKMDWVAQQSLVSIASGVSFGSEDQIPQTNAGTNDFDYSSELSYTSPTLTIGGQIKFPATQDASADANTLDDYEEGTWTPDLQFGEAKVDITYGTQTGTYTKIGRVVHVNLQIGLTSKGTSNGRARIYGLPFTVGVSAPCIPWVDTVSFADFISIQGYDTHIGLDEITNAGVRSNLDDNNFANNSYIRASLTYRV